MRVVFGCYVYEFHKHYCYNIAEELAHRGHESIFAEKGKVYDADFTIQPDQIYPRLAGRGIFINHGLVNFPQNSFLMERACIDAIQVNSDYVFVPSSGWLDWYSQYQKPMYITGYVRIDKLFNNLDPDTATVVYAPTHHYKKDVYCTWDVNEIEKMCNAHGFKFIHRGHPVFNKNEITLEDSFRRATIFISDYSSVGLEALALKIPTILIGNERWRENDHISHLASINAGQRVYNQDEFNIALDLLKDPIFNMESRIEWSEKLCEYQGTSAKRMVDVMESLL